MPLRKPGTQRPGPRRSTGCWSGSGAAPTGRGWSLSLVLIGFDGPRRGAASPALVRQTLERRSRSTDVIGMFDRRTTFAVLPDTAATGCPGLRRPDAAEAAA